MIHFPKIGWMATPIPFRFKVIENVNTRRVGQMVAFDVRETTIWATSGQAAMAKFRAKRGDQ